MKVANTAFFVAGQSSGLCLFWFAYSGFFPWSYFVAFLILFATGIYFERKDIE